MQLNDWAGHLVFANDVPLDVRVNATAPVVNEMLKAFEDGKIKDGVAFFQQVLLEKIRQANLLEDDVWIQVEHVGVHLDNREGAGLVPIDCHDLLLRVFIDGFNMKLVDCLATWIPATEEGSRWRDFNEALVAGAQGLACV